MHLWFDGQCLQTASRLRGIGRYVQELIRGLASYHPEIELSISFNATMGDEAIAAREVIGPWIKPEHIHVWQGVSEPGEGIFGYTPKRRLSEIAIAHHAACLNPDIALSASPFEGFGDVAVPIIPRSIPGVPVVSIFYDAIPHRFANEYLTTTELKSYYYRRLAFYKEFDLNLCISDFSRLEALDISGNNACINISAGISADFLALLRSGVETNASFPSAKFVLYVGGLDWRKNVTAVVEAFAKLPEDLRNEIKFVLAGDHSSSFLTNIKAHWDTFGLPPNNFIPLGHLSDRDLVGLYKAAGLLIQPSLMEGFGLTALEAMMCGTPVVGSARGALPEVIENPELMFDPRNSQDMADRIARIFHDPDFTARVVARGLEQAQKFNWKKSTEIAAKALIEKAFGIQSQTAITNRSHIRNRTFEAVRTCNVPEDFVAETLARAEPLQPSPGRFLVDATSTVCIDHGTGIQRVTKQITRNLSLRDGQDNIIIYCDGKDGFFKVSIDGESFSPSVDRSEDGKILLRGNDKIVMLDSSWEFYNYHMPILLAARLRGAEVISCLYDTVPLRFEAMCTPGMTDVFAAWFKCALTYSTGFFCISQAVADELHFILKGINFPRRMKIGFWHLGADFSAKIAPLSPGGRSANRRPSFLMVGTIEPRKGHRLAVEAFEALWREDIDAELVIVGKVGWGVEYLITRLREHPEAGRRLHWHERATDDELLGYYAHTDALIAASYSEGFGLPLVEARNFGKPVIASDIPVFREVTKGIQSARFFETGSATSLGSAVRAFLTSCAEDHSPGVEELLWINWADSASELRDLIFEGRWYRTYEPPVEKPYVSIFDHGDTTTSAPLDWDGRRNKVELVEGPVPSEGGRKIQYVLRLTNLSDKVWSSAGVTGQYGVFLTCHVLNASGERITRNKPKFSISFVLIPGDSHYVAIKVPMKAKKQGGVFVEVEMVQDGAAWSDGPMLRLPL